MHVDKRCCGPKEAEVSDKERSFLVYPELNWVVQTGFTHE